VDGEPSQLSLALARLGETSGAKVATLWIGSNNLWYLYDAHDEPMTDEQEQENLSAYTANVRTVVAQLHGAGARVLIGLLDDQLSALWWRTRPTLPQAFPSISADDLTRMSQQVANYNAALRALAAETDNVAVVDFYNTTIFTDSATLADDGNHPNSAGYAAISAIWQSLLSLWLEESK
jgi:lysophospholipase L1-like esterase